MLPSYEVGGRFFSVENFLDNKLGINNDSDSFKNQLKEQETSSLSARVEKVSKEVEEKKDQTNTQSNVDKLWQYKDWKIATRFTRLREPKLEDNTVPVFLTNGFQVRGFDETTSELGDLKVDLRLTAMTQKPLSTRGDEPTTHKIEFLFFGKSKTRLDNPKIDLSEIVFVKEKGLMGIGTAWKKWTTPDLSKIDLDKLKEMKLSPEEYEKAKAEILEGKSNALRVQLVNYQTKLNERLFEHITTCARKNLYVISAFYGQTKKSFIDTNFPVNRSGVLNLISSESDISGLFIRFLIGKTGFSWSSVDKAESEDCDLDVFKKHPSMKGYEKFLMRHVLDLTVNALFVQDYRLTSEISQSLQTKTQITRSSSSSSSSRTNQHPY